MNEHDGITITSDPLYPDTGEEIRIDGRLVGRIRRHTSGAYTGTSAISGLSVVGDLAPTGPGTQEAWRKTTRSDAIRMVLDQAREDLRDEAKEW